MSQKGNKFDFRTSDTVVIVRPTLSFQEQVAEELEALLWANPKGDRAILQRVAVTRVQNSNRNWIREQSQRIGKALDTSGFKNSPFAALK